MKIIHLSDIHAGFDNCTERLEDLVTRIIFTKENASDYVIVITGDSVQDATSAEGYDPVSRQIDRLKTAGFTVLPVPGNHDYGTGSLGSAEYVDKFKKRFFGTTKVTYPIKTIIADTAFLGIDSMAEELHWHDRLFAEGQIGKDQLKRLTDLLKNDPEVTACKHRVVYMHHHPFHYRPLHHLKDSNALGKVLKANPISALLFGHNHDGRVWNGKWNIPRIYDAGTSTSKKGYPNPHRVIDLNQPPACDYDAQF